tara:strand:+ start:825 stop:1070 length:246 start_codon:yes stop_codon:yes gene_type:complete
MSKFYIYDHDKEEALVIKGKSDFMHWLNDHADKDRYSFFSREENIEFIFRDSIRAIKWSSKWLPLSKKVIKILNSKNIRGD